MLRARVKPSPPQADPPCRPAPAPGTVDLRPNSPRQGGANLRSGGVEWGHCLLAFGAVIVVVLAIQSTARGQDKPQLIIADQILVLPDTTSPFPIQYDARNNTPKHSFLRIKNLPAGTKLTEGYRVSTGHWAIPLERLDRLRIRYPRSAPSQASVNIVLVSLDGTVHAERTIKLVGGLQAPTPPRRVSRTQKRDSDTRRRGTDLMSATTNLAVGSAAAAVRKSAETAPVNADRRANKADQSTLAIIRARHYLRRGHQFLLRGNVSAARRFYRRATDLGLGPAALALAATFDPNELSNLGIVGLPGDAQQALTWYRRAAELGEAKAAARITRLGN